MIQRIAIFLLLGVVIAFAGCSGNSSTPITPSDTQSDTELPFISGVSDTEGTSLMGTYTAEFNLESLTATVTEDRQTGAHFNVTSYLPAPQITVNSYDPGTGIVDADVEITNSSAISGYDLRLIVFTDNVGHKLINSDSWTGLYDKPGGLPINPFKAYAKTKPNRIFNNKTSLSENCRVYIPHGNFAVSIAIEASYPGNCAEPYEFSGFTQGTLYDTAGSSTPISTKILDWQNDVNYVGLFCPQITGVNLVSFASQGSDIWGMNLVNNAGALEGNYTGYLVARSSNSGSLGLYNEVTIHVTHETTGVEPVGDLIVVKVNRGEQGADPELITSVDFDWDDSNGAVEYAMERGDGYNGTGWTVCGTSTTSSFKFQPTGLDLDNDIRFRVIARAVIGGDPASDAAPSEEVFILFMSDMGAMGGTNENAWIQVQKDTSDGIWMTGWYWSVDGWGQTSLGFYGDNSLGRDTNTWAISYNPFRIPDLAGQTEAWCDGYISPGANWQSITQGFCLGTLSEPPVQGGSAFDFDSSDDLYDPSYYYYDRPNCEGINTQFGETNQAAYKLDPNFGPPEIWRHVGYYMNVLLEEQRDYVAIGYANGSVPLTPGQT